MAYCKGPVVERGLPDSQNKTEWWSSWSERSDPARALKSRKGKDHIWILLVPQKSSKVLLKPRRLHNGSEWKFWWLLPEMMAVETESGCIWEILEIELVSLAAEFDKGLGCKGEGSKKQDPQVSVWAAGKGMLLTEREAALDSSHWEKVRHLGSSQRTDWRCGSGVHLDQMSRPCRSNPLENMRTNHGYVMGCGEQKNS